jgi:predicted nuclease of predicted toxin-antitoxin system
MRILLDECIPKKLKRSFAGHACLTVPEAGLAGLTNGELLAEAQRQQFQVFLTLDKGVAYQQNLADRSIAIIVIRAKSNRLDDLLPHVDACIAKLNTAPGEVVVVGTP